MTMSECLICRTPIKTIALAAMAPSRAFGTRRMKVILAKWCHLSTLRRLQRVTLQKGCWICSLGALRKDRNVDSLMLDFMSFGRLWTRGGRHNWSDVEKK